MTAMDKAKRSVDLGMTIVVLLLMAYARIGDAAHEALGCAMFALMTMHIVFNFSWYRRLATGKYSAYRILQTVLDFLILGGMLTSLVSGMSMSRFVFESLGLGFNMSAARIAHLLASHWGFCLMSIHLGMHWTVVASWLSGRWRETRRPAWLRILPLAAAWILAAYGAFAFIQRGLWRYMLLLTRFAFLDFEEPLPLFLADHLAIMGFFILAGFFLAKANRGPAKRSSTGSPARRMAEQDLLVRRDA